MQLVGRCVKLRCLMPGNLNNVINQKGCIIAWANRKWTPSLYWLTPALEMPLNLAGAGQLFQWCHVLSKNEFEIINSRRNVERIMSNFVVSTAPADGLAAIGAKPSAGTTMTKFGPCKSMGPALERLNVFLAMIPCKFKNLFFQIIAIVSSTLIQCIS